MTDGVPPLPRDSHVSVVYKNSMYVFGGKIFYIEVQFIIKRHLY